MAAEKLPDIARRLITSQFPGDDFSFLEPERLGTAHVEFHSLGSSATIAVGCRYDHLRSRKHCAYSSPHIYSFAGDRSRMPPPWGRQVTDSAGRVPAPLVTGGGIGLLTGVGMPHPALTAESAGSVSNRFREPVRQRCYDWAFSRSMASYE